MLRILIFIVFLKGLCFANPFVGLFDPKCVVLQGDCPNDNVTFWLYTNQTVDAPLKLDPLNLSPDSFQPRKPLYILIHGYTGNRDFSPNVYIRPALLETKDVYVISVDYGPLVPYPCYFTAVENLPLASKCLGHFINTMTEQNVVENDDIHIIGFSLGAQVAGQTAKYLNRTLKRITGLDPAKPMFVTVGSDLKLDPTDAEFVDVIHTDVLGRGMLRSMGHVDFYPNIGPYQPGCREDNMDDPGSCNHDRAPMYYAESIRSSDGFWAYSCPSWLHNVFGMCNQYSNDELMGHNVKQSASGSFFLRTRHISPFAMGKQIPDNPQTRFQPPLYDYYEIFDNEFEPQLRKAFVDWTDNEFVEFRRATEFNNEKKTANNLPISLYFKSAIGFPCYFAQDECPNEDIQFWYYNKDSPDAPIILDPLNLTHDIFQQKNILEILIHGFTLDKDKTPNLELRPLLLEHVGTDVISVDYAPLARFPCLYPWAVENTRTVAKCLALLLNNFVGQGLYTPQQMHLIGFSLGAQIAGLTANHLNFKLRKITGLDPGVIGFRSDDPSDKLDPSDAQFVDVIHTDPYVFSDIHPMGHADFYPNVGTIIQPGCSIFEEIRNCNHYRAAVYYAESITTNVGFWSYYCGNYWNYFKAQCDQFHHVKQELMGYYVSESANGSYFLETNSRPPFARVIIEAELTVSDAITKP